MGRSGFCRQTTLDRSDDLATRIERSHPRHGDGWQVRNPLAHGGDQVEAGNEMFALERLVGANSGRAQ